MTIPMKTGIFFLALNLLRCSCSTNSVTVNRKGQGSTQLYNLNDFDNPIQTFDTESIKLNVSDISGKALRFYRQPDKTVVMIFLDPEEQDHQINIDLNSKNFFGENKESQSDNRSFDLVIRAFQAIVEKRYEDAKKLAQTLAKFKPSISAPYILEGMAWYYEGNREKSVASYQQALALDPSNIELKAIVEKIK